MIERDTQLRAVFNDRLGQWRLCHNQLCESGEMSVVATIMNSGDDEADAEWANLIVDTFNKARSVRTSVDRTDHVLQLVESGISVQLAMAQAGTSPPTIKARAAVDQIFLQRWEAASTAVSRRRSIDEVAYQRVLDAIATGLPAAAACTQEGFHLATFYRKNPDWPRTGRLDVTSEMIGEVTKLVESGKFMTNACKQVGIDPRTYRRRTR